MMFPAILALLAFTARNVSAALGKVRSIALSKASAATHWNKSRVLLTAHLIARTALRQGLIHASLGRSCEDACDLLFEGNHPCNADGIAQYDSLDKVGSAIRFVWEVDQYSSVCTTGESSSVPAMYTFLSDRCTYVGRGATPDCASVAPFDWDLLCCCAQPGKHFDRCLVPDLPTNAPTNATTNDLVVAPPPGNSWKIGQSTFTMSSLGDDKKATITASYELNLPDGRGPLSGFYTTSLLQATDDDFLCTKTSSAPRYVSTVPGGRPAFSPTQDTITIDFGMMDSTGGMENDTTGTLKFCHVLTLTTIAGLVMDIRATQLTVTIDLTADFSDPKLTTEIRKTVAKQEDTDFDLSNTLTVTVDNALVRSGQGTKLTIGSKSSSVKVKMIRTLFIDSLNDGITGDDLAMITDGHDARTVPITGLTCDKFPGTCELTAYFPMQYVTANSARVVTLRGTAGLSLLKLADDRLLQEEAAATVGDEEAEATAEFVITLATMPIDEDGDDDDDVNGPGVIGIVGGSVCVVAAVAVAAMIRRKKMVAKQVAMAKEEPVEPVDIMVTMD
jgi:hypothetical protein